METAARKRGMIARMNAGYQHCPNCLADPGQGAGEQNGSHRFVSLHQCRARGCPTIFCSDCSGSSRTAGVRCPKCGHDQINLDFDDAHFPR